MFLAFKKISLAVAASLVGLILCEGALRLTTGSDFPETETFFRGLLIYDPVVSWRNVPGVISGRRMANDRWVETTYEVNSMGFRGPEIRRDKPEGVTRIVCLGDSGTFGVLSLSDDSAPDGYRFFAIPNYPDFLQARLFREGLNNVEVINAGVVGYSSNHGLRQLIVKVLELEPDIITVRFSANDSHPSWDTARRSIEPSNPVTRALLYDFHDWKITRLLLHTYQSIPGFHPEKDSVLWTSSKRFKTNLERMIELGRQHDAEVIFIDYPIPVLEKKDREDRQARYGRARFHLIPKLQAIVHSVALFNGVELLETRQPLLAGAAELFDKRDLVHPNERGAALIADLLFEKLQSLDWL